jgi:uncharacterized membrane protein YkoI
MKRRTKYVATGAVAAALVAVGAGVSAASGGFDSETPITGDALVKASAAALAATGGGRVTETEVGDEEAYYEVEVTLDDGRQVDVAIDRDFKVVGTKTDGGDRPGDNDSDD